jgi:GT2 family glycosyltransferase
VGFFDPQYSFYYSDYDYNKRATLLGWKIIYIPDALVKHKVSLSTQKGPNAAHWWRNMGEAEVRFYRQYKNGVKLSLHMLWIIMRTILQGKGQYVPAYLSGVRRGFDI